MCYVSLSLPPTHMHTHNLVHQSHTRTMVRKVFARGKKRGSPVTLHADPRMPTFPTCVLLQPGPARQVTGTGTSDPTPVAAPYLGKRREVSWERQRIHTAHAQAHATLPPISLSLIPYPLIHRPSSDVYTYTCVHSPEPTAPELGAWKPGSLEAWGPPQECIFHSTRQLPPPPPGT